MRHVVKSALWLQLIAILIWLWPIGLGGKMPVGGDVTNFSIGLMAELARALHQGRLPIWNGLWGYGFPGIGESQMGVCYPPHWLFYGLLPLEMAYTVSLVFHTLLGTFGAYWTARRFGVSEVGAALNGFAWSACGFFWIHLSHQWSYTTACWMPWAWGLAWTSLGQKPGRSPFWLALVIALQLLPGHFQLAFITQVGIALIVFSRLISRPIDFGGVVRTSIAVAWAFPLAGLQLWPTLRLARLASSERDFEYLSGFAASPLHLITFLAPGLFEVSPLWRPIVWDPFHTSPEEYLGFVGVVPLFLAIGALTKGWRSKPETRALAIVIAGTAWLAMGPYVPGFEWLCRVPGFSFFRGPSRWILATSLGITLLGGIGFDDLVNRKRLGRSLSAFVVACLLLGAATLAVVDIGVTAPSRTAAGVVYAKVLDFLPWREPGVHRKIVQDASRPNLDFRIQESWARQGVTLKTSPRPIFEKLRFTIYRQELGGTLAILAALLGMAILGSKPRLFAGGLVIIAVADLFLNGRPKRIDHGPIASLVEQSPTLKRLSTMQGHPRTLDPLRNLPMVADVSPLSAYRTLDLPVVNSLTSLALVRPSNAEEEAMAIQAARVATGSFRIFDPSESLEITNKGGHWPDWSHLETIRDPSLAGWVYGADWVSQQEGRVENFRLARIGGPGHFAWMLPAKTSVLDKARNDWSGNPADIVSTLRTAVPISASALSEGEWELVLPALPDHAANEPRLIVICQLADPQWEATLNGRPISTFRAFGIAGQGAWTGIVLPDNREERLRLRYDGRDIREGWMISAVAVLIWGGALLRSARTKKEP